MHARLLIAAALSLPLLFQGGQATASSICERLGSELAGLPRVVADTASARKYASAIARQNIQLRKAKSDLRRLGCSSGSIVVIGGANAENCRTLEGVIGKMERNLQVLDRKRREFSSGTSTQVTRRRLVAALDANGCNNASTKVVTAATREKLRPVERERVSTLPLDAAPEGSETVRLQKLRSSSGHGNLRTVCVRTCDGGFFPISSGATPLDFRRDQKVCAMMCPQTETELFYHSLSGQPETGDMTSSVTGRPYALLPTAFAYRTRDLSQPGTCGCDLSAYHQEMIRREKAASGDPDAGQSASAGTRMDNRGSVTGIRSTLPLVDKPADLKPIEERAYDPNDSRIRTIGPAFLPENEAAIDLRNPASARVN